MSHRPRKRFGQHFLHDPGVIARIVAAIDPRPGDRLVEIGPGSGAITADLLRCAGRLDVVELDRDLVGPLQARFAHLGELRVHQGDALKVELCALGGMYDPLRLVGNLPYNVSTPLLFRFLDQRGCVRDMHFMLQKEVVARMAAEPGGKEYGRLSVMLQVHCTVTRLFDIGPGAFTPPPKVDSSLVRLIPFGSPPWPIDDPQRFARLVADAFSQRRKTLRNALKQRFDARMFDRAGIDPGTRAEQLAPADFVRLANSG
ncbi:MAG: 16S rRNA (adenine(1518)-N(6)/adenine(1519)-N(6))-dimethyltransferase RsmA [Xanthomonadales bacterium]|nr:16S rRNA (adenine(1518)-N(6)/adenine(1519)-N(6))-dimethyltransferase RsmA [Xanthomonadales bacterium]